MRACLLALVLVACGGDSATNDATTTPSDTRDTQDTTTPGTLAFEPDDVTGEAVALVLASATTDRLTFDVVTRGFRADDLIMSVGFRLTYDPSVLAFVSATPGPAWQDAVTMASGATPGIVVAGVAHPHAFYEEPAAPTGDVVLYTIVFDVASVASAPMTLVARRSRALVWPGGDDPERVLDVRFADGKLAVEPP